MGYQGNQENQGRKKSPEQLRRAAFEKLWIWQESYQLYLEICRICQFLPREERFRLRDQIERSSASVPDNIGERKRLSRGSRISRFEGHRADQGHQGNNAA